MARPARSLGNLPVQLTSFVGRRRELTELRKTLTDAHLVTLVGPGGVGKSRLAIRLAADVARGFSGGVWLVELAEVRDPALVVNAAIAAMDLRDQAARDPLALLLAHLAGRDVLVVMDNCEHLVDAAARLAIDLIGAAHGVRVLATSREPLAVPGEHVFPVAPLELPPACDEPLADLRQNEAVTLFTERAAAASGAFELTPANQSAVIDVCRQLDGLPLAIELAAVRTRVLAVEQIRDRLTDRFGLLTGGSRAALPRHQTLRTAIDWSHDLLGAGERALLRRLCVFAGRFTLDDVEGVCTSDGVQQEQCLDLLSSLVDKSLVVKEDVAGHACYRLHQTMREYAGLELRAAGEHEVTEERCADYYRSRCQGSAGDARYQLVGWLRWMDLEIDNVRWVLRRCLNGGDVQRGIELVTSLRYFWITRATSEGVRWLDELVASDSGDAEVRARAYYLRGLLAALQADPAAARRALDLSVAAARQTGRPALLSPSLSLRSIAEHMAGDHASATISLEEARALTAGLDDFLATITLLQAESLDGLFEHDLDAVTAAATEGVRLSREHGDLYSLEMMLLSLGNAARSAGDPADAKARYAEGLRTARTIDDRVAQFHFVEALGCLAAEAGQVRVAATLLGAAETMRSAQGANVAPWSAPSLAQAEARTVSALGEARFREEFEAGRRLRRDAALALALGEADPVRPPGAGGASGGLLRTREAEVAGLIAEGLSNRQIGARLFISERTVDSHVRNLLNKLGFNTRAQIAAWMASSNSAAGPIR